MMAKQTVTTAALAQSTGRQMDAFSWLHLTDLHCGQTGEKHLWPNFRKAFFEDLAKVYERCGPWQIASQGWYPKELVAELGHRPGRNSNETGPSSAGDELFLETFALVASLVREDIFLCVVHLVYQGIDFVRLQIRLVFFRNYPSIAVLPPATPVPCHSHS